MMAKWITSSAASPLDVDDAIGGSPSNRPDKRNALSPTLRQLREAMLGPTT